MELSVWEEHRKQKAVRAGIWCLIAISLFYAVVCTPVYHWSVSNVLIMDTVFPQIWEMVQYLIQFLFYWTAFSFFIFLAARYTIRACRPFLIGYTVCVVLRYFANLVAGYVMMAGKDGWSDLGSDLLYLLLDVLGDAAQMALVVLIVWLLTERGRPGKENGNLRLSKLFGWRDPLLRCLWLAAAVPSAVSLLARIRYDLFFGAPQSRYDLLTMVFFYFLTVVSVLVGYLAIFLIVNQLNLKEEEAKQHAGENIPGDPL